MERWRAHLIKDIDRILRESQEADLGSFGAAIWLQQELGLSWEEATHFARRVVPLEDVPAIPSYREIINTESVSWSMDAKARKEHDRQSRKMAELFAERLNMSTEEYMATIPPFSPLPYVAKYPQEPLVPLLVEGRIPWTEQARISGISMDESLADYDILDWNSQGFIIPERPFTTWVSIGYSSRVTRNFKEGHRGAGILEGIAYRNAYPSTIKDTSTFKNTLVVLLGSVVSYKGSKEMDYRKALCLDGRSDSSTVSLRLFPNNPDEEGWFHYLGSGTVVKT